MNIMEATTANCKMYKAEANFGESILNYGASKNMPLENACQKIKNDCIGMSLGPPILEDETKFKHENLDIDLDPPKLELSDVKFKIDEEISEKPRQSAVFRDSKKSSPVSKKLCVKLFKQILMPKQLRVHLQKLENVFPRSLSCSKCSYKAKNKGCYYSHMKMHNKKYEICPECQKVVDIRFLQAHMLIHAASIDDKLKCPKCSYTSLYPSNMSRHQKRHEGDKYQKYKHCPECSYMTTDSGNLRRHYTTIHSPDSNYACELCDFTSKHKSSWQLHISTQHVRYSQRKKLECFKCSRVFLTGRGLQIHIAVHHKEPDDVTKFNCMHCAYSTVIKQSLQCHMKSRHKSKGCKFQTMFRCVSCKFEIDEESNMEDHMQQYHQNIPDECQYEVWEVPKA